MLAEDWGRVFDWHGASNKGDFVFVCEHASAFIPASFHGLGLPAELQKAHIAWDPGALDVAKLMADRLESPLLAGEISRLVYDCNRPPEAKDAVPPKSEIFDIPGNCALSDAETQARADKVYYPFHNALEAHLSARAKPPVLVTIHSFTPTYKGEQREVEIGVLHDEDQRLADAILADTSLTERWKTQRNSPYGPEDGVTHTLKRHAEPDHLLNVMLEIRNDLLTTPEGCTAVADVLSDCLMTARSKFDPEVTAT